MQELKTLREEDDMCHHTQDGRGLKLLRCSPYSDFTPDKILSIDKYLIENHFKHTQSLFELLK